MPIGNGIFNANSIEEALKKNIKCTKQAISALVDVPYSLLKTPKWKKKIKAQDLGLGY